jgi:hypothetical protein
MTSLLERLMLIQIEFNILEIQDFLEAGRL